MTVHELAFAATFLLAFVLFALWRISSKLSETCEGILSSMEEIKNAVETIAETVAPLPDEDEINAGIARQAVAVAENRARRGSRAAEGGENERK
jgi:hypothetical protein